MESIVVIVLVIIGLLIVGRLIPRVPPPPPNPEMICPHCQVKGKVYASRITEKAGVSGGKATAAILTGGVSILATGLSRKVNFTQCHCSNCGSNWTF